MGQLLEGQWQSDNKFATKNGEFVRKSPSFRNWITHDGSKGITGESGFAAEKDRYHLYVSLACPWAHRTLIFRKLKGLEDFISEQLKTIARTSFFRRGTWIMSPGLKGCLEK